MELIVQESGNFKPTFKMNAAIGKCFLKESGQTDVEIKNPTFVANLPQARTAWMDFQEGKKPSIIYDEVFGERGPQPSPDHKEGVCFQVASEDFFGGIAEVSANSKSVQKALQPFFSQIGTEESKGKLPVLKLASWEEIPMKGRQPFYKPVIELVKWIETDIFETEAAPTAEPASQKNSDNEF